MFPLSPSPSTYKRVGGCECLSAERALFGAVVVPIVMLHRVITSEEASLKSFRRRRE